MESRTRRRARHASCGRGSPARAPAGTTRGASTRCANIAVAAPPSAGTSRPSISGQSVNASPAPTGAHVRAHEQQRAGRRDRRSRAKPRRAVVAGPPPSPASASVVAATKITSATNASATAKCSGDPPRVQVRVDDDPAEDRLRRRRAGTRPRPATRSDGIVAVRRSTRRTAVATTSTETTNTEEPVRVLDQRVDRPRREQLSGLHCGHVGAAEARAGAADQTARRRTARGRDGGGERRASGNGSSECGTMRRLMISHRGTDAVLAILTHDGSRADPHRAARRRCAPGARSTEARRVPRRGPRRDGRVAPAARCSIDEVIRLVGAGGKRLRPAFCYWGFRAAGGADGEPIVRAAAALELLHTMALIHDDLMDRSSERRGVARQRAPARRTREPAWTPGPRACRRVPGPARRRPRCGPGRPPAVGVRIPARPLGRPRSTATTRMRIDMARRAVPRRRRAASPIRATAAPLKGGSLHGRGAAARSARPSPAPTDPSTTALARVRRTARRGVPVTRRPTRR